MVASEYANIDFFSKSNIFMDMRVIEAADSQWLGPRLQEIFVFPCLCQTYQNRSTF